MEPRKCIRCGKKFVPTNARNRYCSGECAYYIPKNTLKGVVYQCEYCGGDFSPKMKRQRFCSTRCMINGMAAERDRFIVFERDNFKCFYCGRTSYGDGIELHVDHIHPFSKGGDNTIANLVTACKECNVSKSNRVLDNEKELLAEIAKRNKHAQLNKNITIKFDGRHFYDRE